MSTDPKKVRDNSGAMWKNKRKKSENHPDFTGEVTIAGREYYLSGWMRTSGAGNPYTSLAFKPKVPKPDYRPPHSSYPVNTGKTQPSAPPPREPGEDDDYPR